MNLSIIHRHVIRFELSKEIINGEEENEEEKMWMNFKWSSKQDEKRDPIADTNAKMNPQSFFETLSFASRVKPWELNNCLSEARYCKNIDSAIGTKKGNAIR